MLVNINSYLFLIIFQYTIQTKKILYIYYKHYTKMENNQANLVLRRTDSTMLDPNANMLNVTAVVSPRKARQLGRLKTLWRNMKLWVKTLRWRL